MYVSGRIDLAQSPALVVPGESVVIRDGRSYVFAVQGNRVSQVAVTTGRRVNNQIEIIEGLDSECARRRARRRVPQRRRRHRDRTDRGRRLTR